MHRQIVPGMRVSNRGIFWSQMTRVMLEKAATRATVHFQGLEICGKMSMTCKHLPWMVTWQPSYLHQESHELAFS